MFFNYGYIYRDLVVDTFEKTSATEQAYNVSAVKNIHGAARSVFILERYLIYNQGLTMPMASRTAGCISDSRSELKSIPCLLTNLYICTANLSRITNTRRYRC